MGRDKTTCKEERMMMDSVLRAKCRCECVMISKRLDERVSEDECVQDLPFLIKESKALLGHWAIVKETTNDDPYALFQYIKFRLIVKMYMGLLENQTTQHKVFSETANEFDALARILRF
jgi:hypothetical protein